MRNRLAYAFAVSALTTTLFAQPLGETIEVRVANVDVVVTDRDGHPIHGLTKDDFELYENRKLQPITNFYEIAGETPAAEDGRRATEPVPAAMRRRSLVVFIDNSSIDPLRRNQALDATIRAIEKLMRPGDDAMLVGWDHRTQILQPFTTDPAALQRALESGRKLTAAASTIAWQKNDVSSFVSTLKTAIESRRQKPAEAYAQAVSKARAYAEWLRSTQREMLRSLTQTILTLSGVEGKKLLIFVGGELQETPGLDVFQAVDSAFVGYLRASIMPAVIRESDLNMTDDMQKVARTANANGVTLYMINVADRSRNASEGSMQNAPDADIEFTKEANTYLSMGRLAWDTGGAILSGTTNYAVVLDTIATDLGSYYSLGYKPPANAGVNRTITVKVKRPGAIVRTRRGYAIKGAEEQIHDRVIANAFHSASRSDFPVTIETAAPEPFQNGLYKVKVTLTFPSDLTYLPDGQDVAGEYNVFFVTAGEDGSLSPVGKQAQTVRFPATALDSVKQRPFTHATALIVKPGSQIVSVAVVDKLGARTGFARTSITSPSQPPGAPPR